MNYSQQKLKNGLTLLSVPMVGAESVTALLMVRVGSRDEGKKINGLSHFVEHMVFKGTKKWPTTQQVNKVIDSVGGVFNAFTGQEYTGFWVKVAKPHLGLGLEFLNQIIFNCLLPEVELERERGVILEEIKMRDDDPMVKVSDEFVSQVYSMTSLGQDVIGTSENIKSIKREEFIKHLQAWYQPKNMVLAVAGATGEAKNLAEKIFLSNSKGEILKQDNLTFKQDKPVTKVINKKIEQAHFCLGVRTFPRKDEDRFGLAVLKTVLGGNTSSRLWNEIRENRGLAYYVRSSTDSFKETGYLVTQAGCAINKLEEIVKITVSEYQKMVDKVITNQELKLAKEYLKGRLALAFEDSQTMAGEYGESLLMENKVVTVEEMNQEIEKVDETAIKRIAKRIFIPSQLNLTVVGEVDDNIVRRLI